MTWELVNKNNSRTRIGVETTFGTTATNMKEVVLVGEAMPLAKSTQKMLPNRDQRRRRRDFIRPVKGLQKESPVEMTVEVKGLVARLDDAATPVAYTHANALSHQLVMRAMFGAELTPAAGSEVQASSGVTAVICDAGHGARFAVGQIFAVETASGLEIRRVATIVSDTLTPDRTLAGIPTVGGAVLNAYNYYPAESDRAWWTVDHAYVESGAAETQRRGRGCVFSGELSLAVGEIPTIKLTGTSTACDGPGALGITTAPAADDMGEPFVWDPALTFDALATAPTMTEISTLKLTLPHKHQAVVGPGVEGISQMVEVASRDSEIIVELSGHMGAVEYAAFTANTERHLMAYVLDGSAATARAMGLYFPRLIPMEQPVEVAEGELVFFSGKYLALAANPAGWTLATPEIQLANVIGFLL